MHSLVLRASVYQLPIRSIRSLLQTRRFQTSFLTETGLPVTTGVRFRGINDTGPRHEKFTYWDQLFDIGTRGELGYAGDYFKTWNWELGFRYSRNEGQDLSVGEVSQPALRDGALGYQIRATAFNPFLGINGMNSPNARGAGLCDAA